MQESFLFHKINLKAKQLENFILRDLFSQNNERFYIVRFYLSLKWQDYLIYHNPLKISNFVKNHKKPLGASLSKCNTAPYFLL